MRFRTVALFCLVLFAFDGTSQNWKPFEKFSGIWIRVDDSTKGEKWWITDTGLKGFGFVINPHNGDTAHSENLWIINDQEFFYYVAEVKENSQPILFRLLTSNKLQFDFSNSAHDFPKNISYLFNKDLLDVTISGSEGQRSFVLSFRKQSVDQ